MNHTKITGGLVLMMFTIMLALAGDFDANLIGDALMQTGKMIYFGLTR